MLHLEQSVHENCCVWENSKKSGYLKNMFVFFNSFMTEGPIMQKPIPYMLKPSWLQRLTYEVFVSNDTVSLRDSSKLPKFWTLSNTQQIFHLLIISHLHIPIVIICRPIIKCVNFDYPKYLSNISLLMEIKEMF